MRYLQAPQSARLKVLCRPIPRRTGAGGGGGRRGGGGFPLDPIWSRTWVSCWTCNPWWLSDAGKGRTWRLLYWLSSRPVHQTIAATVGSAVRPTTPGCLVPIFVSISRLHHLDPGQKMIKRIVPNKRLQMELWISVYTNTWQNHRNFCYRKILVSPFNKI